MNNLLLSRCQYCGILSINLNTCPNCEETITRIRTFIRLSNGKKKVRQLLKERKLTTDKLPKALRI